MILRYTGGKNKAAPLLKSLLPLDYSEYRECMVGGGGLYWKIPPDKKRWINDKDPSIVNVYKRLKRDPKFIGQLLRLGKSLDCADQIYRDFQLAKLDFVVDDDELAYVLMSRYAYGQFIKKSSRLNIASLSFHHLRNGFFPLSRERLTKARAILQRTKITAGDYSKCLEAPGEDCVVHIDPPYWLGDRVHGQPLYDCLFTLKEHEELAERLRWSQHRWILTLGDDELTHRLYVRDGRYQVYYRRYVASGVIRKNQPKLKELIICNYDD